MNQRRKNIELGDFSSAKQINTIKPSDRLKLAKQVLLGLGVICAAVFIGYAIDPDNKALKAIFELIKVGVFPLVTLVVSFYFPKSPE
uniref:Uncharacterized protein n=1 Tax=Candidatus Kentrum sp. LFY TaxID=2126342 RepID=A0A450WQL1_9GAMM|nr:MAG: hypothetical protein BECKLFY1418C_GA0070996_10564 [Candidatus Kentron sp. LFY]